MRGRLSWVLGAAGGVVLLRALARRRRRLGQAPSPLADPRAGELRRKLEESRSLVGERDEFEAGETPVDRAEP
ncbi:MAG: hypothetical protein ACRDN6_12120, partial [Gaiellaceae bacterium]